MASVETDRRFGVNSSQAIKVPCDMCSTSNITLSAEQTIDGQVSSESRCLVKGQSDASENGIYDTQSGAWVRSPDWNGPNDVVTGTMIRVHSGTSNRGYHEVTTTGTITVGTTSVTIADTDGGSTIGADLASTANGLGASLVGVEDAAANYAGADVEAVLAEIIADYALTTSGNGASKIGVFDTAANFAGADVEAVLAEIIADYAATSNGNGFSKIGIEDATAYWTGTDGESVLDEIGAHILSNKNRINVPLFSVREATTFDVGNIAANGGLLASDTTPVLDAINAGTDGCQRVLWAAADVTQVIFQVLVPPDIDASANLLLQTRIASGGTTDAVGFTVETFFDEADTKITDTSGTNQTTSFSVGTTIIAAGDIPSTPTTMTVGLTPVAHGTDTMALTAIYFTYQSVLLT